MKRFQDNVNNCHFRLEQQWKWRRANLDKGRDQQGEWQEGRG